MEKDSKYLFFVIGLVAGVILTLVYLSFSEPNYSNRHECEVKEMQKNQVNYSRSIIDGVTKNDYTSAVRLYCHELMKSKSKD